MTRPRTLAHGFTRLAWAAVLGGLMAACGSGSGNDTAPTAPTATTATANAAPIRANLGQANDITVSINPLAAGRAVNRQVLGHNVQWVDKGDEMVDAQGQLKPAMLALAQALGPTVLRYPGGLQSDTYHWALGMGPVAARGSNEHANAGTLQPTIMGTREFLELCEATGATPLITVNLASGTADEAAAWVRQVNVTGLVSTRTGKPLPKVMLWELGNEPYLQPAEQPKLWMSPAEFGNRARQFLVAMKAVDASIQISLPLTNDKRNGFDATPYQGFTREVLKTPINGLSFISLHNAYVPLALDKAYSDDQLYWGAMAGSRTLEADFQHMRDLLATLLPGQSLPFAVTEYNSLFTLTQNRSASDALPLSPAGALAVADVMRVLASTPDVAMAHFWSLSGNGFFGAIHTQGRARPAYEVLKLFGEALQGEMITARVSAPTVDTPSVGGSAAVTGLPVAEALVTRSSNTLRIVLIHKDPANPALVRLDLGAGPGSSPASTITRQRMSLLSSQQLFDTSDSPGVMQRSESTPAIGAAISLPPHSAALITLELQAAPPPSSLP